MFRTMKNVTMALALGAAVMLAGGVQAADWPSKPITMLIGYKAGGGTGFSFSKSGRLLQDPL